jgi:type IV pilus assembly protein PilB
MDKIDTIRGIEEVLYEKGLINSDQLSAIKFEHVNTGKSIEAIIKERNYVSSEDFVKAQGEAYGVEFTSLNEAEIDPNILEIIPTEAARRYRSVPYALKGDMLQVAMVDPLDLQTIEFIERKSGYKVVPFITTEKNIERVLEEQKGKAIGEEINAALEELNQTTVKIEENQGEITDATLRDAPIARIVGMILETAVKTGASDVHIEPGEDVSRLRYRIDGILEEKRKLPKEMHESIVARIKILGKMKIDEKRVPQDGRFKVQVGTTSTDLRISTLPTIYGEKVVIRLLKEEGAVFSFKDLGLRNMSLKRLEEAILKPNGIILVTGPTGSGKTVTLASALNKLNTIRVNIVTLEDPVEIRVPGVNQVQVNPQAGLTFATGLRAFLRQDPNIIMVGEVRDGETAELAIHAALTGHLVLSTLHTNSAAGAIPRLLDMGVENFLLASTVNVIVAQRLCRKICQNCKTEYEAPEEVKQDFERTLDSIINSKIILSKDPEVAKDIKEFLASKNGKLMLHKGKGCEKCGGVGYKGRIGIFEVLPVTEAVSRQALDNSPATKIQSIAVEEGMVTLIQDGYLRVLEGLTTLEEVLRVAK